MTTVADTVSKPSRLREADDLLLELVAVAALENGRETAVAACASGLRSCIVSFRLDLFTHHPDNSDSLKPARPCDTGSPRTSKDLAIDSTTTTMTPAWIVCAWPPLLWQASRAPQLHLTHLGRTC